MTFVDMNAVQFYQPPKAAGTRKDRQPAVSSLRPFTVLGPSEKGKGTLPNLDQIENLDMTGLPLKEPLNPFHVSASNFSGIEADAGGISNELDTTHDHNLSSLIQNNNSISITDLLLNPEEVQEWQGLELTEEPIAADANYSEDGNTKNVQREAMGQYNLIMIPESDDGIEGPKDRDIQASDPIVIQDEDTDSSGSDILEEQAGTLSTPSTSVAGSEAGAPSLPKKNKHSTSKPPPPHRNSIIVSSKHDRPMCEFEGGKHKSLTPDPSADDDKEAEMADEEEGFDGDSERDTLPCQRSTKRSLCRVKEKPIKKRCMDISSYTPSKPRQPRPTSSHLTSLEGGDTSDDSAMDLAGGGSQMAVIYKQQSWKGEIVQERDVKKGQGPGRPHKQYLVQWEQSWVDSDALIAPTLLQNWREKKKASKK